MRPGPANSRAPVVGVPGSWSAAEPGASPGAATGGSPARSTAARLGYPVAASAPAPAPGVVGADRAPVDPSGSGVANSRAGLAPGLAPGAASAATTGAPSSSRPGSATLSLTVTSMGGQQVQLSWNTFTAASPTTYEVRRCAALTSAAATCGTVATVKGGGYRLTQADGVYFVRALGPQGQPEGESVRVQVCCRS
jgi:hypothetical protein